MFRQNLPRIYELRDQIKNPDSPNSCFQHLDDLLQDSSMMQKWRTIENELQGLDSTAWEFLKTEAKGYLLGWDAKRGRGRQQLLNIINQAKAYNFLRKNGCSDIHFISRSKKKRVKTPDLQGSLCSAKMLCEVKTISPSDDEMRRRCGGDYNPQLKLEQGFFNKLMSAVNQAKKQLWDYNADKETRRIVYIIPNFDDFWGEHKEEYFQQIDQYLCENPVHDVEIVFHNQQPTFNTTITMKCATLFNE